MSSAPIPQPERTPLGLPAGSIRSILALTVMIAFWLYVSLPKIEKVPLHIECLFMTVLLFFVAHGKTIRGDGQGGHSPLYLPKGTLRYLIIFGTMGIVGYQLYIDAPGLMERFRPDDQDFKRWPYLYATLLLGFFAGWSISRFSWKNWPAYQDFQAWVAILALLSMLAECLYRVFVNPKAHIIDDRVIWECILVGVYAFYYGNRS